MNLHPLDIAILLVYLILTLGIGFWLSKRASKNIDNYFLGGNTIPWYMLGLSNASGMFDIAGTMWMVYLLFVYGLKSVWIPWLWPVFNQIFMMVYLSVWLRRSGVMTGAEWINFRFGESRGAKLSHIIVIAFAVINVIGFLAYGFVGIGKFAATYIPYQLAEDPTLNVKLYGLLIVTITTLYVVKGGMISVVFTEVLQFFIMTVACIWVGIIGMHEVSPELLDQFIPEGWRNIFFGWTLNLDWSGIMESANARIKSDGWTFFSFFVMMMLFKGLLQSGAGPLPNYDMQRVLSARTPRDAAKMSGIINIVLLIPRYMLITGLTVLALVHFSDDLIGIGDAVDFELVLPFAMKNFLPIGLTGLLLAALIAAFMSTFAATVNAAPAYLVNDIYKKYINPEADEKTYVYMSYATSLLVVFIGVGFGWFVDSLNDIIQWLVAALYGGYTASNVLKWHWWRFNSYGYFWGMLSGILAALFIPLVFDKVTPLYNFPHIFGISLLGCFLGSYYSKPDDIEVLKNFYRKVRPWGFWKPVYEEVKKENPEALPNKNFKRDAINIVVGIIWQTAITASGIYLVIQEYIYLAICALVILITTIILKYNWYDKMKNYPPDVDASEYDKKRKVNPVESSE